MEALIAARAIAGMGGGGLTSIGSIVVSDVGEFWRYRLSEQTY